MQLSTVILFYRWCCRGKHLAVFGSDACFTSHTLRLRRGRQIPLPKTHLYQADYTLHAAHCKAVNLMVVGVEAWGNHGASSRVSGEDQQITHNNRTAAAGGPASQTL